MEDLELSRSYPNFQNAGQLSKEYDMRFIFANNANIALSYLIWSRMTQDSLKFLTNLSSPNFDSFLHVY